MHPAEVRQFSQLDDTCRALKLARTIADLAEALQYRPKVMLG